MNAVGSCAWLFLWIVAAGASAQSVAPDTTKLAALVRAPRSESPWFGGRTIEEFSTLRQAFIVWTDARLRRGIVVEAINEELRWAGLFQPTDWPKTDHEPDLFEGFSGYLGPIEAQPIQGAPDLLEVRLHIGLACGYDDVVAVYARDFRRRLGWLEFPLGSGVPWRFTNIQAGQPDSTGSRLLAAAAVVTWCTSVHQAVRMYAAPILGSEMKTLLARTAGANIGDREIEVAMKGSSVTFTYDADKVDIGWTEKVHYSLVNGKLRREPPIAATRAGLVTEWLAMNEAEAARWSEPNAAQGHRELTARIARTYLQFVGIALCSDLTSEITAKFGDAEQRVVFRLAMPFRLLAITSTADKNCRLTEPETLTEPLR